MPTWKWFAFDADAITSTILYPAQQAIRNCDLSTWQKIYDQLRHTHYRPCFSFHDLTGGYIPNEETIILADNIELSRNKIPQETELPLRRVLQRAVEQMSALHVSGKFPQARQWLLNEVSWEAVLKTPEELDELELFKNKIIARNEKLPDPFWCLASNRVVDSNYCAPETVVQMARVEANVGLFRRLVQRTDVGDELHRLARDLASASLLTELAASLGLAVYFREDAT